MKTQTIKLFLNNKTHKDLAELYSASMEVQVNVARDKGEKVSGEVNGHQWIGYSDGIETWKSFRIPWKAYSEPEYRDSPLNYSTDHFDAIGMTGWNWEKRVSQWVAFDFDAIIGHSTRHTRKMDETELENIRTILHDIPWVTIRKSTSGKGLHIYVFVDNIPTANHNEHSALARSILSHLSGLLAYDFERKVDICGGNMWVWARKMTPDGLTLIKQGSILKDIPPNWRDHLNIIKGKTPRIRHKFSLDETEQKFDDLVNKKNKVPLDAKHKELLTFLDSRNLFFWWDADAHMLVTHTLHLKRAHQELNLKGIFETSSKGENLDEQNCFAYPLRNGVWSVRRYSQGTEEHKSWEQDGQGWTKCYLNKEPDFRSACLAFAGLEDTNGSFSFQCSELQKAALLLGVNANIPQAFHNKQGSLKRHKDGRLVMEIERNAHDPTLQGWLAKGSKWVRMFSTATQDTNLDFEVETENFEDVIRHLVSPNHENAGWVININNRWNNEPQAHVKLALEAMNYKAQEVKSILGSCVMKPWTLVIQPFGPEYPGNRTWNFKAPRFRVEPTKGDKFYFPMWQKILHHVGKSLTPYMTEELKNMGIFSGADYLTYWLASMIQYPFEPLPYLFIYSNEQKTGKTTFHEAVETLFNSGVKRAEAALKNPSDFNGELEGAIVCVVEEIDLARNKVAYNKIKDWVTSRKISIHIKRETPYQIPNTTHWIQCSNDRNYCPVFPGDTRITMINVPEKPTEVVSRQRMFDLLERETADFLGHLLSIDLHEPVDRLMIPVLDTPDKMVLASANQSTLELFLSERCYYAPGQHITLANFFETFIAYCEPQERLAWSKQKVSTNMPDKYLKGRLKTDASWCWGNISFTPPTEVSKYRYVLNAYGSGYLELVENV